MDERLRQEVPPVFRDRAFGWRGGNAQKSDGCGKNGFFHEAPPQGC